MYMDIQYMYLCIYMYIYVYIRLISASLTQLSRDITNDIIVKQNIFDVM